MTDFTPIPIPLYKRTHLVGYALVDPDDAPLVQDAHWSLTSQGYALCTQAHKFGAEKYMHRVIAQAAPGQVVDHINGNRLDNRRANLRGCTQAQNIRNARRINGESGFRGVQQDKRDQRWSATITVDRKTLSLGRYGTPEEAARAYDSAARYFHEEYAVLNFPDEPTTDGINWAEHFQNRDRPARRRLSPERARVIRERHEKGAAVNDLAKEYEVSPGTVYGVISRRTYRTDPAPELMERALSRVAQGEAVYRVAKDMKIGVHILSQAAKKKWGKDVPATIYKRRHDAKLSEAQVDEIVARHAAGETQKALAKEFKVSAATVNYYTTRRLKLAQ